MSGRWVCKDLATFKAPVRRQHPFFELNPSNQWDVMGREMHRTLNTSTCSFARPSRMTYANLNWFQPVGMEIQND